MAKRHPTIRRELLRRVKASNRLPERMGKSAQIAGNILKRSQTIRSADFSSLSSNDLKQLFVAIDNTYFAESVGELAEELGRPISFRVSKRMTNSGGITTTRYPTRKNKPIEYEIAIASTLLFESFQDNRAVSVTGVLCTNRLQALQRIMEHEMIHLIEMLLWNDSSCSANRFQQIASRIFGHKQSSHQLITPTDSAKSKFDIAAGDWVQFHANGKSMFGFVNRITKRATVLVPSNSGIAYNDGKTYQKYYVPVNQLRKAS